MNLAKAFKQKNRLAQKISQLQREIQSENSIRSDNVRKVSVIDLMSELEKATNDIIKIKIAIFIASTPMRENIFRLGELKSYISFIQGINTTEGKNQRWAGAEAEEFYVEFDKIWVKENVEKCQKQIDDIQEELDKFNYITEIEV